MPHIGNFFNPLDYFESPPTDGEVKKAPNSDWAFDHKANPGDHHVKFTDSDAKAAAGLRPFSIGAQGFVPWQDTHDWILTDVYLRNRASLEVQYFYAPVFFPGNVTILKLMLYGYRDDALATLSVELRRIGYTGVSDLMANVIADWTDGEGSGYDASINYATINNSTHSYMLKLEIKPNDSVDDVRFRRAYIEWN